MAVLVALAGAAAGVLGAFAQAGPVWSLGLAVATPIAVVASARALVPGRTAAVVAFLAWALPVGVLSLQRPEGDLVVAADARGVIFLLLPLVACGVLLGLPPVDSTRRPAPLPAPSREPPSA